MHDCLRISELLRLVFGFIKTSCEDKVGKRTLASLARTCHLFSPPALDALWHDLYSFGPLLNVFPIAASSVDDARWSTFRKYATRVKILHGRDMHVLMLFKQVFVSAVQHCPPAYLPLLPNLVELRWFECSLQVGENSSISLLGYFSSPGMTTITLFLIPRSSYTPAERAAFAYLPRYCPNVTSFTIVPTFHCPQKPSEDIGRMVTQWPRLRTLQACLVPQSAMDQLFSRPTLEVLGITCRDSSPIYNGRIPDTVREFSLNATSRAACARFLETAYASPTRFRLVLCADGREDLEAEDVFYLLPRRLDTSRLVSLTIRPLPNSVRTPLRDAPKLLDPLISAIVEFTALRELDLDHLFTAWTTDVDYTRMARFLPHLRSLKFGTANPHTMGLGPVASVEAVIAVLTHCKHLETFHIVFDGCIPPPEPLGELTCQGWGVSNRQLTRFCVGHSPIGNVTTHLLAACLKSIMPCLTHIEYTSKLEGWKEVQNVLSCAEQQ